MLKVSAFYLEKQKSFIPKKNKLSRSQYQNKKALFTDPIFSDGFGCTLTLGNNFPVAVGGLTATPGLTPGNWYSTIIFQHV